jgi:hypothetical protein
MQILEKIMIMKDMKVLSDEELEKVSGSGKFPGFPGVGFGTVPKPDSNDKPKDGGATYTWCSCH